MPTRDGNTMRYVDVLRPGGPDVMFVTHGRTPTAGPDEVRISVRAAGVNRADLLQRAGSYPPPSTASPILGLEVAGMVSAVGDRAGPLWRVGDEVCALVEGGGYATECVAPAAQCLPIPAGLTMIEAATLPEAVFTVWYNVFRRCRLAAGDSFLVHGGTSGVGVIAIQLAHAIGAHVLATAGSPEKCAVCIQLGADVAIDYHAADFVDVVLDRTDGSGVDVVLDMVGGDYLERHLRVLALDGCLAQIAFMEGSRVTIDLLPMMTKRLTLTGSTMRRLPESEKAALAQDILQRAWPLIARGLVTPIVAATFPLEHAPDAHRAVEAPHIGKVVLTT